MRKTWVIFLVVTLVIIAVISGIRWLSANPDNSTNQGDYTAQRTSQNTEQNIDLVPEVVETELYSFSTPILSDSENRLTNIKITCSRINESIIKSGKEFSFCDIVGKPTADDGYKAADAFGSDGEIIQAIGGRKLSSKYYYI